MKPVCVKVYEYSHQLCGYYSIGVRFGRKPTRTPTKLQGLSAPTPTTPKSQSVILNLNGIVVVLGTPQISSRKPFYKHHVKV